MIESDSLAAPLEVGPVTLPNRVFLAPMSGVTDAAFRSRATAHGAGMVVSEMIASGELAKRRAGSVTRLRRAGNAPLVVQLAGREACWMAEGARIAVAGGADIVDINMGCPAKKVTGGYAGSALMRDLDQAISLIDAVLSAVDVPVTVKMRLGWDEQALNAPILARRAEAAGVAMVTVHGRTRCQFYQGKADWRAIRRVREAVSIPLVANGDVGSRADAVEILEQSGADAVMVGRGAYGAPWLPGEIAGRGRAPGAPDEESLAGYVVAHYEEMLSLYGVEQGLRHARKHLGWYLDRHRPQLDPAMRAAIMTATDPRQVIADLRSAFAAVALRRLAA